MSQLQDAIRRAQEVQQENARSHEDQSGRGTRSIRSGEYKRDYPVTVYDLQPSHHFELKPEVLERNRIIHENYALEDLTPYKMLRTRVLQKMEASQWRTLAVTSAHEGAGKTVTSINLAITIALQGDHEVYLLDLDLRKPGIANCLGLPAQRDGISDFLTERRTLGEVLWEVGIEHLLVVPGKERIANSSELITSPRMKELMSTIRSVQGDPIAIIDLPPVLSADDALAIAPMVDAVLLVVSEGETRRADMLRSMELMKNTNIIGVTLNKSHGPRQGY